MGVIGSYLDVVFEVSEQRVNTFDKFSRTGDARIEKHNVLHQKPLLEFEGPDTESISFEVKLRADLGINPLAELGKWKKSWAQGRYGIFMLAQKPVSNIAFIIKKITENHKTFDKYGNVLSIELELELLEYPITIRNSNNVTVIQPKSAPAAKGLIGTMNVTAKSIHIRSGPGINNKVVGYAFKGNSLKVYGIINGWYDLGSGRFISANSQYSIFKGVT